MLEEPAERRCFIVLNDGGSFFHFWFMERFFDPVSQWKKEAEMKPWIGLRGSVVSFTGDDFVGRYVLVDTAKGRRTVRLVSSCQEIGIGDDVELWIGQEEVLSDGRILHGLVAHKVWN